MKYMLLDAVPVVTIWGGAGLTAVVGVVSYLFSRSEKKQDEEIKEMKDRQSRDNDALKKCIEKLELEDRKINEKINEVNIKILTDINGLGIKLAEFKRDLTK